MTNHVHLLLTPTDETGCSLMMRDLARCYSSYFNRRYSKTGQLWEGRFRSCLVDTATYVLGCHRYIELNPVLARMVPSPGDYFWSSYAGNAGAREDRLLTQHAEFAALGADEVSRVRAYTGLTTMGDADCLSALREATEAGFPLVGQRLKSQLDSQGVRIGRNRPGPRASLDSREGPGAGQLELLTK